MIIWAIADQTESLLDNDAKQSKVRMTFQVADVDTRVINWFNADLVALIVLWAWCAFWNCWLLRPSHLCLLRLLFSVVACLCSQTLASDGPLPIALGLVHSAFGNANRWLTKRIELQPPCAKLSCSVWKLHWLLRQGQSHRLRTTPVRTRTSQQLHNRLVNGFTYSLIKRHIENIQLRLVTVIDLSWRRLSR